MFLWEHVYLPSFWVSSQSWVAFLEKWSLYVAFWIHGLHWSMCGRIYTLQFFLLTVIVRLFFRVSLRYWYSTKFVCVLCNSLLIDNGPTLFSLTTKAVLRLPLGQTIQFAEISLLMSVIWFFSFWCHLWEASICVRYNGWNSEPMDNLETRILLRISSSC